MANKPKIRKRAIRNLTARYLRKISWNEFRQAFTAGTPDERATFGELLSNGSPVSMRRFALKIVRRDLELKAETAVDLALADDNLTLDEFEDLFN
jgi:hypothetical protein